MKIRYSDSDDLSIDGSCQEFHKLMEQINKFLNSSESKLVIDVEKGFDPAPFQKAVDSLVIEKAELNEVRLSESSANIVGNVEFLTSLAENLPFDVEDIPYHTHYDACSFPEFFENDALGIIFQATI